MKPKLITFDCANTLIWTDWQPHTFALRCSSKAGIKLPVGADKIYLDLFLPKVPEFWKINQLRSLEAWRGFWVQQVQDWLNALGLTGYDALELHLVGEREIFETPSDTFKLFDDTVPALTGLKHRSANLTVLSNWDHSLHKCLEAHRISHFFDLVFASLEEGVEKPDEKFFQLALDHFKVSPSDCFHVGDDLTDDFQGASQIGIPTVLIDRNQPSNRETKIIHTLLDLEEAFTWFD